jgi:restriction system protein
MAPQMERRRKLDNIVDDLHDLFMRVPAWFCVPVAGVAFVAVKAWIPVLARENPILTGIAQQSQLLAGIVALVILAAGFEAAVNKWKRRQLYDGQTSIESIRDLSWSAFELLIGEAYRRQGYQVEENGGGGADGGIDLILNGRGERILVQCKQWKVYKVGVKPIREMYGVLTAEGADRAIFVTSGVYTQEARNFAARKRLDLIDGNALSRLISPIRDQQGEQNLKHIPSPEPATSPVCPICRSPMVLKTAHAGPNVGSQFWGCSTYSKTKCRGIRQVDQV